MVLPRASKAKRSATSRGGRVQKRLFDDHAATLRKAVKAGHIAGSCEIVFFKGREIFRKSFGMADLEAKVPFRDDTICRIYCQSKAYMNFTAMMLVDEGLLRLDAPVGDYIPSLRRLRVADPGGKVKLARKQPKVRNLLTHSAGFSYGVDFNYPPDELQSRYKGLVEGIEQGRVRSLAAFVDELGKIPLCFEPGKKYHYSYCTDVLGRVMEVASGKPLDELLRQRLFEPLGMCDTSFSVPRNKLSRLSGIYGNAMSWGHLNEGKKGAVPLASKPGLVRIDGNSPAESAWSAPRVRVLSGGGLVGYNRGGLVSTAQDTLAFVKMLLAGGLAPDGRRLMARATLKKMEQNQLVGSWKEPGTRWCLLGDMQGGNLQQGGAAGNYWSMNRKKGWAIVHFMQQVDGEGWEDTDLDPEKAEIDQVVQKVVTKAQKLR